MNVYYSGMINVECDYDFVLLFFDFVVILMGVSFLWFYSGSDS